jgi:2-polyprenyl-6-methoxyphenol hydroxylase-like FAD-dependent oxidoreductase
VSDTRHRRRGTVEGCDVAVAGATNARFYDPYAFVYALWPMVSAGQCHMLDANRLRRLPMIRYSAGETATIARHAIVLGASMAGLLAARVLSEFYATVTVVERDTLDDAATVCRGVPQGRHIHGLLMRGARAVEELFPGLLDELADDGAAVFDGTDLSKLYFCMGGHVAVRTGAAKELTIYNATRPFLECHIRRRVRAIPNVAVLDDHDIVDVCVAASGRVTGASVVSRSSQMESTMEADLVVDATGRGARTPVLLKKAGYDPPAEDDVAIDLMYASQLLRMPGDALHETGFIVSPVPGRPTGMAIAKCENDTAFFTVFGMAGNDPPVELSAMCAFAEGFTPAHALAAVRAAEPLGPVAQHRFPSSRWRRYDKARRLPEGLLVVGDAVCSFNPIYAQGMTVAALEALALRDCLSRGADDLPRRFFRAAAHPIGQAWQLAVGGDLSLPEIKGTPPLATRLLNGYIDRFLTAAEYDTKAFEQFVRIAWLVDTPAKLLQPNMIRRVLTKRRITRRGELPLGQAVPARSG